MITLELKGAGSFKLINEIEIGTNREKLLKTISNCYTKAPYYNDAIELIKRILESSEKNLAKFIAASITEISKYLAIDTNILISSEIDKDNSRRADDKVMHICKILGTTQYLNAIGGTELYSKDKFKAEGLELKFINTLPTNYTQYGKDFIPWLSIIDIMMFNSPEEINKMLNNYELQ
jgi:hypothetical protein